MEIRHFLVLRKQLIVFNRWENLKVLQGQTSSVLKRATSFMPTHYIILKIMSKKKIPLIFLFFVVTCFQVQLVRKVLQKWVVLISLGSGLSHWEMSGLKKVILGHENFGLSVCWGGFLQEEEAIRLLKVSHSPLSTHHVYKAWEKKDQNRMSRKTKPWPTPWSVGA